MASFIELIKEKLEPLFISKGFHPVEVGENSLKYELGDLQIKFFFDSRERSSNLFIWCRGHGTIMIGDDTLRNVFGSPELILGLTPEDFVANVKRFLMNEGSSLLAGDGEEIARLEKYAYRRNIEYTERTSSGRATRNDE